MDANITMLPVTAGDATLVTWRDRGNAHAVLIDAGLHDHEAIAYLQSIGVFHLDLIILSHPDMDHLGGLLAIIKSEAMSVDRIWCFDLNFLREFIRTGKIPRPVPATREVVYDYFLRATLDQFSDILNTANGKNVQILQVSEGYKLALGGVLLEVLYPPQSFYDSLSNPEALKQMLAKRKWPVDWNRGSREEQAGGRAQALTPQERQERLTELFENPQISGEEMPLLTELEPRLEETSEGEPAVRNEEGAKLPWKMVGTLYNNLSIVVKLTVLGGINGPSILLTGDLSDWTTLILRQWPNLKADVLKLPHHGSKHIGFDGRFVRRMLDRWLHRFPFAEKYDPVWWPAFGPYSLSDWLRVRSALQHSDPADFLQNLVFPAYILVFPYPRYRLPSMPLGNFHSNLIANRIDRDPSLLHHATNAACPARMSVGLENDGIEELSS
jgi:beta-lactamase superfamily II metal-dependent hydrolase